MTKQEARALKYQTWIERRMNRIERDWRHIARYLSIVYNESLYEQFDLSFEEWCKTVRISKSMGYDLVAIQNSTYRENLETLNMSLARLVLPHLKDAEENVDPNTIIDAVRDMTWEDANQYLNGNSPLLKWVESQCPRCKAILELSRNAQVRIK